MIVAFPGSVRIGRYEINPTRGPFITSQSFLVTNGTMPKFVGALEEVLDQMVEYHEGSGQAADVEVEISSSGIFSLSVRGQHFNENYSASIIRRVATKDGLKPCKEGFYFQTVAELGVFLYALKESLKHTIIAPTPLKRVVHEIAMKLLALPEETALRILDRWMKKEDLQDLELVAKQTAHRAQLDPTDFPHLFNKMKENLPNITAKVMLDHILKRGSV
jgi:hypothetical protein